MNAFADQIKNKICIIFPEILIFTGYNSSRQKLRIRRTHINKFKVIFQAI
jgi:hypothetical protein